MAFMRDAEFSALRREMRSERELAVSFLGAQLATNDDDDATAADPRFRGGAGAARTTGSGRRGGAPTRSIMTEMRAMRRELRLERERAKQVEARQRRELEQTRKAADAAVASAESVANLQKTHMRLVMKARRARMSPYVMDKLIPNRKTAMVAARGKYDAADIADEALRRIASSNVPASTGDGVEEQQGRCGGDGSARHPSRLGQIAAAASALAVATVRHSVAAAAEEEKRKRLVATLGKTRGRFERRRNAREDHDEKKSPAPIVGRTTPWTSSCSPRS